MEEVEEAISTDPALQDIASALDPQTLRFNLAAFSGDSFNHQPSGSGSHQPIVLRSERMEGPSNQQ